MDSFRLLPCGDRALTVQLGDEISEFVNGRVHGLYNRLQAHPPDGVVELVPAYCSLTLHYRPEFVSLEVLCEKLREVLAHYSGASGAPGEIVDIPVLYGGEAGPDLENVSRHCSLAPSEVIRLHATPVYRIYMLGFTPGFPYLGGMDGRIATPRLLTPRVRIPAGSVGIAGGQTGIYPIASPGGWQLIGRTPLSLFDPHRPQPFLLSAGQRLRFVPVDAGQYRRLEGGGSRA